MSNWSNDEFEGLILATGWLFLPFWFMMGLGISLIFVLPFLQCVGISIVTGLIMAPVTTVIIYYIELGAKGNGS